MTYVIGKPINNISINGNEYLLDSNGLIMEFEDKNKCLSYIRENITKENPEDLLWDWEEIINE